MENVEKYELTILFEIYRDWISEIDFYQNEIDFLEELLSQHLIAIKKPAYNNISDQLIQNITQIKALLIHIKSIIYTQNKLLSVIIENNSRGEDTFEKNHLLLMADFKNLINKVKEIKLSVYTILKDVLKKNKQKRLIQ
ncbi:MAG: hypothetical protein KGZ87_01615 [Bacteroidetes bacterium]|nr:hypothetical protein [Bacteroidota bacterium]